MANTYYRNKNTQIWINDPRAEFCEHTEKDKSLAFMVIGESDSFGPLSRVVVCEPCYNQAIEHEENLLQPCHDCKKRFKTKELNEWKWWDFYANQGDTPLLICNECWEATTHQARLKHDREEYDYEHGNREQRQAEWEEFDRLYGDDDPRYNEEYDED